MKTPVPRSWTQEPCGAPDGIGNAISIGDEAGEIAIVVPHEAMDANARLVAAAPDLLAALVDLISISNGIDQSATNDGLMNCKIIAKARAAISKAEGCT